MSEHDGESTTPTGPVDAARLFERHHPLLEQALAASRQRGYFSPYEENPRRYPDVEAGRAAFEARRGVPFALAHPGDTGRVGAEHSPYGFDLGISYPAIDPDVLLPAMSAAIPAWRDAGPDARTGVVLEILHRLNQRSPEIGWAQSFASGQSFGMAFQAGGPHAQGRGLEAVAHAYAEMTRYPRRASFEKPQGKRDPIRLASEFTVVPRGVALVIGCQTFPTWNSYPGLFASLVTGNAVLLKPHPHAVLPLAITAQVAREVLVETGFAPELVSLAAEEQGGRLAATLALRPQVRVIDYTGGREFGEWLEQHARQAVVHTEKSGVNPVVVDSTDDYPGMLRNLASSLALYSGQMCTTPRNLFVPRDGITVAGEHRSFDEFATDLAGAVSELLADPSRAHAMLGALLGPQVAERVERASGGAYGPVLLAASTLENPEHPGARVRTPVLVRLDAADVKVYASEHLGPIAFLIATDGTEASIELLRETAAEHGAITAALYSTSAAVREAATAAAWDAGVALSVNLVGNVFVNQTAAFADFHATGANPAANSTLCDGAFVANRFRFVQSRTLA